MSLQSARDFTVAAAKDPALAEKVNEALSGKSGDQAAASFAAAGKSSGYDFTAAEAKEVRSSFLQAMQQLSENDLEKVAGGFGGGGSRGDFASGPGCTTVQPGGGAQPGWGGLFGPAKIGEQAIGDSPMTIGGGLGRDPKTWSPTPLDSPINVAGGFFKTW